MDAAGKPALCRDCLCEFDGDSPCPACKSTRVVSHRELQGLTIAHVDCDAFYASIEKRDNPKLRSKPVIVGGGHRGVVAAACYISRINHVRSAMPMFLARKMCPRAVIVPPRMEVYSAVSSQIRRLLLRYTPQVEPIALDEAYLDLSGTELLHSKPPAVVLAQIANQISEHFGVSVSIGLSYNKFLAKVASDLDKPRGYAVIGHNDTQEVLSPLYVGRIGGVGRETRKLLAKHNIYTIGDLRRFGRLELRQLVGPYGDRLWELSRGQDDRKVIPDVSTKSISNERTFQEDHSQVDILGAHLWKLCEQVSARAKAKDLQASVIKLKVKKSNHTILSRQMQIPIPTQSAELIYDHARRLLGKVMPDAPFRLIGVGLEGLGKSAGGIASEAALDPDKTTRVRTELATDKLRSKYGQGVITKGRALPLHKS
ncbi:MAG: DNA polymerase IV [Rhodobacteraceae bacterium]|nr:DNA polymerase IV [Paracoccaceae bacterium]